MYGDWDVPSVIFRNIEKGLEGKCTYDTGGCPFGSRTLTITDQHNEKHEIYLFGSYPSESEVRKHAKQAAGWEFLHSPDADTKNWYPIIESNWESFLRK
ncbi:hypothetical protein NI385_26510 (plasmid) [Vibrio parahaemolyticus]|nr:hypothetical protein NI385_26510 [Vibrio parahaemolyticus]